MASLYTSCARACLTAAEMVELLVGLDLELVGQLFPTECNFGADCYTLSNLQENMNAVFMSPIVRGLVALSMGLILAYLSLVFLRKAVGIMTATPSVERVGAEPEHLTTYDGERKEKRGSSGGDYE